MQQILFVSFYIDIDKTSAGKGWEPGQCNDARCTKLVYIKV